MRLSTLKTRAEFARIKDGGKWVTRSFILQGKPRDEAELSSEVRFGFAVSGKALAEKGKGRAGAVTRNRAKRRLREALRLIAAVAAKPGYDYVIVGRREALHQPFPDLLEDMRQAFEKVHRPRKNKASQSMSRQNGPKVERQRHVTSSPHSGRSAVGEDKS
ncbi:MAG: ribonuclease P protein component [Alphaproteobacteria bacterium]